MHGKVIVLFQMHKRGQQVDLELPLEMTARELVTALDQAYELGLENDAMYLACENPIALLRGERTLAAFGLRNGSVIHFTR